MTAPLDIGVDYVDTSETDAALGVSTSTTVTAKSAAEALVAGINAAGGLAGRKLVPVEFGFNGNDADYGTDATAACAKFTQDNHVPVVLDLAFGTIGGFRDCLQKAGVLDITTGDEGDRGPSIAASLHANTFRMSVDRIYAAVLDQLTASGYIGKANQLGIVLEQCPEDMTAYTNTIEPMISRLGLKAPVEAGISCTSGFSSAGAAASAIASAVLAFRQSGVDRVMIVSGFEQTALLLFAENADSQMYDPGYLLSSTAQVAVLRPSLPAGQWPQLHGVGRFRVPTSTTRGRPRTAQSRGASPSPGREV